MGRRSLCVLLLSALAAVCHAAGRLGADGIPLRLDRGGLKPGQSWVLGAGVPLKEGQVKDPRSIGIRGRKGKWLPSVWEARTRYPDGSVQWLWGDFYASAEESYSLTTAEADAKALPKPGVQVVRRGNTLSVSNGVVKLTWDTRFAAPMRIECTPESGGPVAVARGDGAGIYVLDQTGRKAVLGGQGAELDFRVETHNGLRAVLRIEGWYARDDGERLARAVIRYHLYWQQATIRMEHHLILTRENDEASFKEVGIRLPVKTSGPAQALFGVQGARSNRISCDKASGEAYIFQSKHPVYYKNESEFVLGRGERTLSSKGEAAGWCDLSDGEAGLVVAVKDFAPQFPKELSADSGGVTVRLWSGRDGKTLDYRPATLAREWWGDWLNREDKIAPASVGTVYTPQQTIAWNPSCIGAARTHELMFGYYLGEQDERQARNWHACFQTPPVVYPDPRWTCHVDPRTFWPMAAKGEGGPKFAGVEEFIAAWFDEFMAPLEVFPYTGWYDFGKHPELRYVKEPTENNRIYAQWWRLAYNNQYQTTKHLMLGWARSGERRYLEAAQRFNRFQVDYKILHAGGGKESKRPGYFVWAAPHRLPYWFSGGGVLGMTGDTEFVTGPALEYLLLDNRWNKDSLELAKKAVLADFKPTVAFTKEAPDMVLSYLVGLYRVSPDEALKRTARTLFDAMTDVNGPIGLNEAFFAGIGGHYHASYKINRKAMALVEYCDVLGDDRSRAIAAKAAAAAGGREGASVCNYCEFYGASCSRAYEWTRNPQFLEPVRRQVAGVQALFAYYRRLAPEQRLVGHVRQFTTVNPLAQAGPHSTYSFKESGLKDAQGYPLALVFSTPSAGVAYLALPTAIWALKGSPGTK